MVEAKPIWLSKTVWVNAILAIAAFIPPVQDYLGKHPDTFVWVFSAVNVILRFISKGKVTLRED